MQKPMVYRCESCGMEFFNHSNKLLNKEEKGVTCPYCESELWHTILIK
jgi:DNA-directed RNA polymerase subunit RPC12/RpoP